MGTLLSNWTGLSSNTSTPLHMSVISRVFDIGGHNKPLVGPIPFIGTIEGVPDVDAIVEGMVGVVINESRRWGKGLVFFVGLLWVLIVGLGVLIVIVLFHGQRVAT